MSNDLRHHFKFAPIVFQTNLSVLLLSVFQTRRPALFLAFVKSIILLQIAFAFWFRVQSAISIWDPTGKERAVCSSEKLTLTDKDKACLVDSKECKIWEVIYMVHMTQGQL